MDQPGVMGPESFPIRDPRSKSLNNGRMLNPARFMEMGGLDAPGKWFGNASTSAQASDKNVIQLESGGPTGVKGAKKSSDYQLGG
jgi:hypothetical protein